MPGVLVYAYMVMQLTGYIIAMDDLVITTPSAREVVMTRSFDAPRALVFEALTTPAVLAKWLLAPGRTLEVCEIDLRPGGAYRMIWRGAGRKDVGTHGVYREVVVPERIVATEAWLDWDAGKTLVTHPVARARRQDRAEVDVGVSVAGCARLGAEVGDGAERDRDVRSPRTRAGRASGDLSSSFAGCAGVRRSATIGFL